MNFLKHSVQLPKKFNDLEAIIRQLAALITR